MVRSDAVLQKAGLADRVHLVMNIHDALVYEVDRSVEPQTVIGLLQPAVTFPVEGFPKIVAEWSVGLRWGTMVDIAVDAEGRILKTEGADDEDPFAEEEADDDETAPKAPAVDVAMLQAVARGSTSQPGPADPAVERQAESQPGPTTPSQEPPSAQRAVDGGALAAIEPGRHLIVSLDDMPTPDQWTRFSGLLADRPGPNTVTLRTPEGDVDLEMQRGTSLGPDDGPVVSMIFSGASVFFDAASVDPAEVFAGVV
jgi:hypothetical protein